MSSEVSLVAMLEAVSRPGWAGASAGRGEKPRSLQHRGWRSQHVLFHKENQSPSKSPASVWHASSAEGGSQRVGNEQRRTRCLGRPCPQPCTTAPSAVGLGGPSSSCLPAPHSPCACDRGATTGEPQAPPSPQPRHRFASRWSRDHVPSSTEELRSLSAGQAGLSLLPQPWLATVLVRRTALWSGWLASQARPLDGEQALQCPNSARAHLSGTAALRERVASFMLWVSKMCSRSPPWILMLAL